MVRARLYPVIVMLSLIVPFLTACTNEQDPPRTPEPAPDLALTLPEPRLRSEVSVEEALLKRRSVREYGNAPLTLEEVSQLLWAAQGITSEWGGRTAPSAGALYPLEVYIAVGNVENLSPGVYKYNPRRHELIKVRDGDVRQELAEAALSQIWVQEGAIDIVIAAVYERTTKKYGDRGVGYVHMEAGHAAQNIYLQAATLDLGMVTVGAFHDDWVKEIMSMPEDEIPLYLIPVGRKG
ncbi:hypothetical protein ES703_06704 [subsurface metagenome]